MPLELCSGTTSDLIIKRVILDKPNAHCPHVKSWLCLTVCWEVNPPAIKLNGSWFNHFSVPTNKFANKHLKQNNLVNLTGFWWRNCRCDSGDLNLCLWKKSVQFTHVWSQPPNSFHSPPFHKPLLPVISWNGVCLWERRSKKLTFTHKWISLLKHLQYTNFFV